jgi:phytoene dehydrogenase-like protein
MKTYKAIIIGTGMGGLAAGTKLAQAGWAPLLLEQASVPGGRCYSREVEGGRFDIGAVYLGQRVPALMQETFSIQSQYRPYRLAARLEGRLIPVPVGIRTMAALMRCGVSPLEITRFMAQIPRLSQPPTFEQYRELGDLVNSLTPNPLLRQLIYISFGVLGVHPAGLPSHYFGMGKAASGEISGDPVYFPGGNRYVADTLLQAVQQHGGQVNFDEKVLGITPHSNAWRVETEHGAYIAERVISNAGLLSTALELTPRPIWPDDTYAKLQTCQPTLEIVNIFLTISGKFRFPRGYGAFFRSQEVLNQFNQLEAGRFPERSMFILQVPGNLEAERPANFHATLQFYHPRGNADVRQVEQQANEALTTGLEELLPGLSGHILQAAVYPPERYAQTFGFRPHVYGITPGKPTERFSSQLPAPNLFCVGDSVAPDRPSVPQALASGIYCANQILQAAS